MSKKTTIALAFAAAGAFVLTLSGIGLLSGYLGRVIDPALWPARPPDSVGGTHRLVLAVANWFQFRSVSLVVLDLLCLFLLAGLYGIAKKENIWPFAGSAAAARTEPFGATLLYLAGAAPALILFASVDYLKGDMERLMHGNLVLKYSFHFSFILVGTILVPTLRPVVVKKQTWKKLKEIWLVLASVPALSVAGFGFFGLETSLKTGNGQMIGALPQVDVAFLKGWYFFLIITVVLAFALQVAGSASADNQESNTPLLYFVPTFGLAWVSNLGLYSLLINCGVLVAYTYALA